MWRKNATVSILEWQHINDTEIDWLQIAGESIGVLTELLRIAFIRRTLHFSTRYAGQVFHRMELVLM